MSMLKQSGILRPWRRESGRSQGPQPLRADAASTFQTAVTSFRDALSEEDRLHLAGITDASEMMKDLRARCAKAKESSKLLAACTSIDKFAKHWQPFFDVVGIFVSSNPEWSALAWGAVRLVFLLSSNYASFFEKLARMLEMISDRLPSYHDHLLCFRERCPDIMKERVRQALSLVYKDILQFCQEACRIFTKKGGGERHKINVIRDLFWHPFDVRFGHLLEKLRDHQELFELEVRVESDKALKRFIDKAERVIDSAGGVMEHQRKIMENPLERIRLDEENTARYETRLKDIKHWLDSSDYATDFDKVRQSRNPGSCTWILKDSEYTSWKLRREAEAYATQVPSILWLEGKPGFGKTTLSISIIEDLKSNSDGNHEYNTANHCAEAVVYFHFDLQRPDKRKYSDALRAAMTQLVHQYQEDCEVIDAISLLMNIKGTGQPKSFPQELADIFLLFMSRLPLMTLVLDGIDECENFVDFLPFLIEASSKPSFRCLFLGRPSVLIPEKYRHCILRHSLKNSNNSDIRDYLLLKATELRDSGDIDEDLNPTHVADLLMPRANSMFLWASLMLYYLQSVALSPAERRAEIEATNRLEDMDKLYCQLLQRLSGRIEKERALLTKIFQFLATSDQPPTLQQLRVAVAIKPGHKLSKSDYIPRFPDALRKLCGALIEIHQDDTVQLIHLSLREFLLSDEASRLNAPFRVEPREASLYLSVTFLSYMIHEVPQVPLSGFPDTLADAEELDKALPLLRFAAQSWVSHATRVISHTSAASDNLPDLISVCQPLIQQLVAFISNKGSISAWIETCWTYEVVPSIQPLWAQLKDMLHRPEIDPQPNPIAVQLSALLTRIQALSEHLAKLQDNWGHLLSLRPYEIWAPSISAFMGSLSWTHNNEAKVTTVGSEETHEQGNNIIIAVSKLSECGRYIGIVKIYRPLRTRGSKISKECACGMSKYHCACNTSVGDIRDAFARYQVIEIAASFPTVLDFHIELDPEDLLSIERNAEGENFRFPIALAPDLTQISILHTAYFIGQGQLLLDQKIDIFPNSYVPQPTFLNRTYECMDYGDTDAESTDSEDVGMQDIDSEDKLSIDIDMKDLDPWEHVPDSRFYRLEFSPCGHFLAVAKRDKDSNDQPEGFWSIAIWKREIVTIRLQQTLLWQVLLEIPNLHGNFLVEGSFAFNPRCTLFVMMETGYSTDSYYFRTMICDFGKETPGKLVPKMVYGSHLRNLHFSPCGRYLFGDHGWFNTLRMVDILEHTEGAVKLPSSSPQPDFGGAVPNNQRPSTSDTILQGTERPCNSTNKLTLQSSNGVPELCTLRKYSDGAVVRKRMNSQKEEEETLLYLPSSMHTNSSLSVINDPQENSDQIHMVLVNNCQDRYTWNSPSNSILPAMITRSENSIREYKLPLRENDIVYEPSELSSVPNSKGQRLLEYIESNLWRVSLLTSRPAG